MTTSTASSGASSRSAWPIVGNSCRRAHSGTALDDLLAEKPGGREARRGHDVARAVREQDRPPDRARERLEVHLLHREACVAHGVGRVLADDRAHHLEDVRGCSSMKSATTAWIVTQVGEVVERQRLRHDAPVAEHRPPVDVAAGHPAVGAGGDRLVRVLRGERDRDHAAHRGAVDKRLLDPERVEQAGTLVGPALDRVVLDRAVGAPVARGVVARAAGSSRGSRR